MHVNIWRQPPPPLRIVMHFCSPLWWKFRVKLPQQIFQKMFERCVCNLAAPTAPFDLAPHAPNLDAVVTRISLTTTPGVGWASDLVDTDPNGNQKRHRTFQARFSTKFSTPSMKFPYWEKLPTSWTRQLYPKSKSCFAILASRSTRKLFLKNRALWTKFTRWYELSTSYRHQLYPRSKISFAILASQLVDQFSTSWTKLSTSDISEVETFFL